MNWIKLTEESQLDQIREESKDQPVMIFKHSITCSTSNMVVNRLERSWNEKEMENVQIYLLELQNYRQISNAIAEQFAVRHESPQVLIIRDGKAVYSRSHFEINFSALQEVIQR